MKTTTMDYYQILNVSQTSTAKEIKLAFKELILKHHPDKLTNVLQKSHENVGRNLIEAYQTLNDPEKRAEYDRKL